MLKISLNDGIDDTVPVENQNQPENRENVQSVASGQFLNGFRQFQVNLANATATLRSRTSIKSEDDLPPPYEAQVSPELAQQSPPPYHVAISMEDDEADDEDQEDPDVHASNQTLPNGEDDDYDNDETD